MLIDECGDYIANTFPRYAITLSNGTILKTTFEEKIILKIVPLLGSIVKEVPIGHLFSKYPWVFLRVSEYILVVLATKAQAEVYEQVLYEFFSQYSEQLGTRYNTIPKTVKDIVKFNILAVARQSGPEPIAWNTAKNLIISQEQAWRYATTSMLVLMNELNGANHSVLNFHPFIGEGFLGVNYLFQIPSIHARGKAVDSALICMINYEDRAIVYENHKQIESIFSITAEEILKAFHQTIGEDIYGPIQDNTAFKKILNALLERLATIILTGKNAVIVRNQMLDTLKHLSKYFT